MDVKHRHAKCRSCGLNLPKKMLIYHTISEYCSLKRESFFTTREILDYSGNKIGRNTVSTHIRDKYPLHDDFSKKRYIYPGN